MGDCVARWRESDVEITEFSGQLVAYRPDADEAWISGWVEVPR